MIAVIDYGIGNVRSVLNALAHLGAEAQLTRDFDTLLAADALILPGVGAFGEGMRRMQAYGLPPILDQFVASGKPLLGICLGFQLLMRRSDELGDHVGLGLLPYDVRRLPVNERLPHIGWNVVKTPSQGHSSRLMTGLEGDAFYFVHSYGVVEPSADVRQAFTSYGGSEIMALVEKDNVFGTQFHPEKSGPAGLQLLTNFVALTHG